MIENIWSGWRSNYVTSLEREHPGSRRRDSVDSPSVFTRLLESTLSDEETFIVHRGELVFTVMNAFPYAVGHVLVLPYRQISEIDELSSSENQELWMEVRRGVSVLRDVLSPDGFNVGLNLGAAAGGSISGHLHVHVVPRWFGDANFTVSTATVKAIPEAIDVTAARIRSAWSDFDRRHERE